VNDSKKGLNSRVDRHEHIGAGAMGLEPFRLLMNDPRFAKVPKFLETPKGDNDEMDVVNLKILRGLVESGNAEGGKHGRKT
jgi:deoxyribonuclease-4